MNIEHNKVVDFVSSFKAANKNTVERIRKFDPRLRSWTYETVKKDPNATKWHEEHISTSKAKKAKEKRQKKSIAKPANPVTVKNRAGKEFSRPETGLNVNVVRLHDNEKLTFRSIAALYDTSASTVVRTYKSIKANEGTVNP